jgi:hypothetical protein
MRITVTTIRLSEDEAKERLNAYVFGGGYGPRRVPRGIDPRFVAKFLLEKIGSMDEDDLGKTLNVARYYESKEIAPAAIKLFDKPIDKMDDWLYQMYAVRLGADLGGAEEATKAARHFESRVVPHPKALQDPPWMLDTAKVTEPHGGMGAAEKRLQQEKAALEPNQRRSEADMGAFDKIAAALRNDFPRAKKVAEYKARLLALPPAERRETLIRVYMDDASVADDYLRIFAARLLRKDVFEGAVPAPIPEFRAIAAAFKPEELRDDPAAAGRFLRAERAYRYFGGGPDAQLKALASSAKAIEADAFLDDD